MKPPALSILFVIASLLSADAGRASHLPKVGELPDGFRADPVRTTEISLVRKGTGKIVWRVYGYAVENQGVWELSSRRCVWFRGDIPFPSSGSGIELQADIIGLQARYNRIAVRLREELPAGLTAELGGEALTTQWLLLEAGHCAKTGASHVCDGAQMNPLHAKVVRLKLIGSSTAEQFLPIECYITEHPPAFADKDPETKLAAPINFPSIRQFNDGYPVPGSPGDLD